MLLAMVVIVLAGLASAGPGEAMAGGGCHADTGIVTDAATTNVDMTAACYQPMVVRVNEGDTVTWTNRDTMTHMVTGVAQSFGNYDGVAYNGTVTATFDDAGVFPYFCALHPSMVGAVVVGDGAPGADAAAAITSSGGDDGGTSTSTIAGIVAAIGVAGAAVGLVGSRVLSGRRSREARA
jgi:plastocyanin